MIDASPREALARVFAQRLAHALERHSSVPRHGRGRIEAVSLLLETSTSTTQRMLAGVALPEAHRLAGIAGKLGVTLDYLFGLAGEKESDCVMSLRSGDEDAVVNEKFLRIPILNALPEVAGDDYIYVSKSRLSSFIHPIEAAAFIAMRGESMAPTVLDGELALIERELLRTERVLPEGIYPMRSRMRPDWTLRRIQPVEGGNYLLISDNPHYAPVKVSHPAICEDGAYEWEVAGRLKTVLKRF